MSRTGSQLRFFDPFGAWKRLHRLEERDQISAAETTQAKNTIYRLMDDLELSPDDLVLPIYLTIEVGLRVESVSENHHEFLMRPQRRPYF